MGRRENLSEVVKVQCFSKLFETSIREDLVSVKGFSYQIVIVETHFSLSVSFILTRNAYDRLLSKKHEASHLFRLNYFMGKYCWYEYNYPIYLCYIFTKSAHGANSV